MASKFPKHQSDVLFCFAVEEEAKFFEPRPFEMLITGMGRKNAADSIRRALPIVQPKLVVTSGFCGGLNPELSLGSIVFDEEFETGLNETLLTAGCISGTFHCARRVAVTAAEKRHLWEATHADAVEMESSVI